MGIRFKILLSAFLILGSLFLLFHGLIAGQNFLIPVVTGIILAMLMTPVASKMINLGIGRVWAVLISDFMVVVFIAFMIFLLAAQANQVAQNWSKIEKNLQPKIERVQKFYNKRLKGSVEKLQQGDQLSKSNSQETSSSNSEDQQKGQVATKENKKSHQQSGQKSISSPKNSSTGLSLGTIRNALTSIVTNIFGFISTLVLILVYVFFFMFYQKKFENALIGLFPKKEQDNVRMIIRKSSKVAQNYLFGRFILIGILAGLYMIAFSLIGIEYAVFIAMLAALFSLLPYIGNFLGFGLAVGMSFITGGGTAQLLWIVASFGLIQFVESYLLEPYVVGDKVDLNPVVIIVGVVLGNIVWGLMGMLLVIPVLGIVKVVLDNVAVLRPLGYALDGRDISEGEEGLFEKAKKWVKTKLIK